MGKMSELDEQIKALRSYGEDIIGIADTLTGMFSSTEELPEKKELTFEEVRHRMTLTAQAGFSAEVKDLIAGFGAKKLSDVDPSDYEELLQKADALGKTEVNENA